ncbi:hypothetical protein L7F22_013221 [Adiantum nelumboides]|nr:hypothetical protein [Adiantum nelumboides]
MEALENSVKTLETKNAKLKEEVTHLKEEIAASKELREDGWIQKTDKVAIKEKIAKQLTKAMEVKMEATKEGWVDVVRNKIKKEVKEEKQHEETVWMHATLEEKKMREAHMLNVRVSGIKEEHGASLEMAISKRLAFYSIAANLVTYLLTEMHEPLPKAVNMVTNWIGAAYVLGIPGGFLADAYLGRFCTIAIYSGCYILGLALVMISATVRSLRPSCAKGIDCGGPSSSHEGELYAGM